MSIFAFGSAWKTWIQIAYFDDHINHHHRTIDFDDHCRKLILMIIVPNLNMVTVMKKHKPQWSNCRIKGILVLALIRLLLGKSDLPFLMMVIIVANWFWWSSTQKFTTWRGLWKKWPALTDSWSRGMPQFGSLIMLLHVPLGKSNTKYGSFLIIVACGQNMMIAIDVPMIC